MSEQYRKLKIIINKSKPYLSRIVDEETGQIILNASSADIHIDPRGNLATIELAMPEIEIEE